MKKKIYISLLLVIGVLAIVLIGKQVIKKENPNKPSVDLTVYTISSNDTERWDKIRQVETEDAVYLISVKEVFSNIIANGTAMGFGVSEEEVKQFNNNLGTTVKDAKNNKLTGIEFFTFSDDGKGFTVANFDYGKKEFNDQKKEKKEFYKKLYEAFKK